MKPILFVLISTLILTCSSLLATTLDNTLNVKALIHTPKLQKINQIDTRIAIELLLHQIADEAELNTATIEYSNNISTAIDDYVSGNYEVLHLTAIELIKEFARLGANTSQYWVFSKIKGKRLRNFYLLVKTDSGISSIQDLIGKRIALTKFDSMQELYLDYTLLKNKMPYKSCFSGYTYNQKGSTSLLNLFFKKVDAAIVTQHSYDIATELNPRLKQTLKILDKSQQIYPSEGITLIGNKNQYFENIFKKQSANLMNNTFGKQLMMIYQSVDNFNLTSQEIQELHTHYKEYLQLKSHYEK